MRIDRNVELIRPERPAKDRIPVDPSVAAAVVAPGATPMQTTQYAISPTSMRPETGELRLDRLSNRAVEAVLVPWP
jgi:hypothetical protein